MNLRPSSRAYLTCAVVSALAVGAASATAADVVVQPAAGSGFVVTDASGAQARLRVNESGEITIPVLVNGVQQNLPLCFGSDGRLGPCAPSTGGTGTNYTAGTGLALGGNAFSVAPTYQLPQTCTANQVAQWSGTAWNCADSSAGFALPYTGTSHSAGTAFWINNYANGGAIVGFASSGIAIEGISAKGHGIKGTGISTDGDGVYGVSSRATGVFGEGVAGNGVAGTATQGVGVYGLNTGTNAGVFGESSGYDGVHGHTSAAAAAGVAGFGDNNSIGVLGGGNAGPGVKGVSTSGYAMVADGPVQQTLNQNGWVKAMLRVERDDATLQGAQKISRCFNSLLPANTASIPPCGFLLQEGIRGATSIAFGFSVYDRFLSATPIDANGDCQSIGVLVSGGTPNNEKIVNISTKDVNCKFFLFVY